MVSLWLVKMASVNEAKRSFWALVNHWKSKKSATLTLKSVNGDLRVSFNVNLGQHDDKESEHQKTHRPLKRGAPSSKQRRKQQRAADPAVKLRAEEPMLLLKLLQKLALRKKLMLRLSEMRNRSTSSLPWCPLLKRRLSERSWGMNLMVMDFVGL